MNDLSEANSIDACPPETVPVEWKRFHELELVWPEWLVHELLPCKSSICLYGKRGHGKTFLALDLALSIATGVPWNGMKVQQGGVAYILAERPEGLRRRIEGWLKSRSDLLEESEPPSEQIGRNFFVTQAEMALNRKGGRKQAQAALTALKETLEAEKHSDGLSLVVFDPLVSFMEGSENDVRDMHELVKGVRKITAEHKCSVLMVHHEGKSNMMNLKGARGSSALEAGMDTVLYLQAMRGHANRCRIEVTKQREHERSVPILVEFRPEVEGEGETTRHLGMFPHVVEEEVKKSLPQRDAQKEREGAILHVLEAKGEGMNITEIKKKVDKFLGPKKTASRNTLDADVKRLVDGGGLSASQGKNRSNEVVYSIISPQNGGG